MRADVPSDWVEGWRALVERPDPQVARRLHQGRAFQYAGRVSDLRIAVGIASARVQDDRATPVPVEVVVPALDDEAWATVIDALAGQVRHTARLLAGHAPDSLDAELEHTGVRVFPVRNELVLSCDCADDVWPCAHGAALWEALAERIAEDPFTLLRLRGRGRERLLGELADARRRRAHGERSSGVAIADLDTARWTRARAGLDGVWVGEPDRPRSPAGPLRLLGDPPGWAGGMDAWGLLHPLVQGAATWAEHLGDLGPDPEDA